MSKHQPYPPTPFYDRLTDLSKLEDGWLDGHGKAPAPQAITSASVLGAALPRDVSLRVYPTEAGGVALEWDDQYGGHEIEVQPDGHLVLMTVERIVEDQMAELRREVAAARKFAADYADRLVEAMDRAKANLNASEWAPSSRRTRLTREHLESVAATYRAALAEGVGPTRAVSDHFGVPHSTAAKWVGHARRRNLLPRAATEASR